MYFMLEAILVYELSPYTISKDATCDSSYCTKQADNVCAQLVATEKRQN